MDHPTREGDAPTELTGRDEQLTKRNPHMSRRVASPVTVRAADSDG